MNMDIFAQQFGFSNVAEMSRLVVMTDISTPEKMHAFREWRAKDGSKIGLLNLPPHNVADSPEEKP